jgi:cation transport regulator ChaC
MRDLDAAVEIIARACGAAGPNYEYAINTWANLAALGIRDSLVEQVADALRAREGARR